MKQPIEHSTFDARNNLFKQLTPFDDIIFSRLNYIFETIGKTFNFDFESWIFLSDDHTYVLNYEDYIKHIFNKNIINTNKIEFDSENGLRDNLFIIINNKKWDLRQKIPKRWLFEQFESELKDGKDLYDFKQLSIEISRKTQLVKSIKTKLTNEELLVIGLL